MPLDIEIGEHRIVSREGVREPNLFRLHTGDLLLTFHVQDDTHFAQRRCLRSSDRGSTWHPDPPRTHREQCMGQSGDGVVLACDTYTFEQEPGRYIGSYFRSADGGKTFTGPHRSVIRVNSVASLEYPTPEHIPPEGHILRSFYQPIPAYYESLVAAASRRKGPSFWRYIIEERGRWLAPMTCRFHGDQRARTILMASEDGGGTWDFVCSLAYDHAEVQDGFCEPAIARTADGSLLCVMRRGSGIPLAQCRSTDGGNTWSPPELIEAYGVDPDLHLMSNGVLACSYGRPGLHVMFSEDGCGRSWSHHTEIGSWRSSTYMGLAETLPGELLVMYDRGLENNPDGGGHIRPEDRHIACATIHVRLKPPTP